MHHDRGNVHYATTLEYYSSEELNASFVNKPISIAQFGTQIDYYLLDRIAIGSIAQIVLPRGERIIDGKGYPANTIGVGLGASLRIEVLNFSHHLFYVEIHRGMVFTADRFPPGGTQWNFMVKNGLGYTIHLSDKKYLLFGWRWMHISNGTGLVPTNPAYDGNGLYIGFKFAR
jgi:hypothetical protein